jgi:hypothetical protein
MGEICISQWPTPGKRGTIVTDPCVVKPLCQSYRLKFRCSAKHPGPTGNSTGATRFRHGALTLWPSQATAAEQFFRCQIGNLAEGRDQMAMLDRETPEAEIGKIDVF